MNNTSPFTLHLGDCLESMRGMADNSVDSVVCDPPYGLSDHTEKDIRACMAAWLAGDEYLHSKKGFMGKTWDSFVPSPEVWREVFRVLKPGGYVLAFASTRTDDLMSMAMRLAGFRKHPFIGWVAGSGFPKAANLSKAFDREAGAVREVVGLREYGDGNTYKGGEQSGRSGGGIMGDAAPRGPGYETTPSTEAAKQWDGWAYGLQSLKPAIEPCLMFQKPHEGRMTDNVLQWGTGAVNIDASRISGDDDLTRACLGHASAAHEGYKRPNHETAEKKVFGSTNGRWPANLILSSCPEVVAGFPVTGASKAAPRGSVQRYDPADLSAKRPKGGNETRGHSDSGGSSARFFKQVTPEAEDLEAARFMYCAKASKSDRSSGMGFEYTLNDGVSVEVIKVIQARLNQMA